MDRPNYLTPAGFAALRAEYDRLFATERPALVETIAWAAGNGDRSENGDYIYGRKRLREIDRRLGWLSKRMKAAKVIDPARQEDRALLSGRGRFIGDIRLDGMLYAAFLRSPHAHARIRSIDVSRAMSLSGVHAVLTCADIRKYVTTDRLIVALPDKTYRQRRDRPILASEETVYVGEPIAIAIAETPYLAEDAIAALDVEFEPLPAAAEGSSPYRVSSSAGSFTPVHSRRGARPSAPDPPDISNTSSRFVRITLIVFLLALASTAPGVRRFPPAGRATRWAVTAPDATCSAA